ncbi:MAG TPA: MOSC N-terminal beta barrel domain-containing protein [Puia sp.]|nr:MOSC N-terminal beta barrel domain-containing protein [Puia sp.]
MLRVSGLFIYPIKSLGGISVSTAEVTDRGLRFDRRWMLVDSDNVFISQRTVPSMALIRVSLGTEALEVRSRLHPDVLRVPYRPLGARFGEVRVWDDTCRGQFVSVEADHWFSAALGITCRLVYMPEETMRITDPNYAPEGGITSFADAFPFLLIGEASLDDLNRRLDGPVPMDRFRPNIVFTGGEPFFEDSLKEFYIRDIRFRGVKLCARCPIPTIDQETAERGKEPLRTLARYRFRDNKVYFGQNLIHQGLGEIAVGDPILVS